jgi:apolipoprotein N-acyltransferase
MSNAVAYKSAQPVTPPKLEAKTKKPQPGSLVWLALAAGLLLISYGAHNVPLAAWLAPVFLLRFVRERRPLLGLGVAYLLLVATFAFQLRGMVPIPGLGYYVFLVGFGVVLILPYGLDRLLVRRLDGWAATLVFPCAWAGTEYVVSLGPYGSWGSAAYSQYGNLPLLQILSVTGLWGVTFLIGWFAAVCNWAWEEGPDSKRVQTGAAIYAAILLGVVLLGGARMAVFPPLAQTVRVASLSKGKVEPEASDTVWQHVLQNSASSAELDEFRAWANAVNGDLLSRAEREAQAGAKIVFWGETNAMVFKEDESTLITRGRDLAAKYGIYLGVAMASWHRGQNPPLENKLVLIQPDGQVAWEYFKAHPVPGGEAAMSIRKDGKLRSLDTPYGRMSSVICFDADFPQLLAQAGALGTDVLLDPSNDWRAIDPWHTQMASFRAIEQGFNLVRHTSQGLSAAYDYQGRRLAAMDHYLATDHTLISQVPIKGVRTIYSRLGDWFAWVCLVGLVGLAGLATWRPSAGANVPNSGH